MPGTLGSKSRSMAGMTTLSSTSRSDQFQRMPSFHPEPGRSGVQSSMFGACVPAFQDWRKKPLITVIGACA